MRTRADRTGETGNDKAPCPPYGDERNPDREGSRPRRRHLSPERKIDEIVYALYGLDERDVALIEKAAPS